MISVDSSMIDRHVRRGIIAKTAAHYGSVVTAVVESLLTARNR